MRNETLVDVYASNVTGAQFDAGMKNLMSNKEIIVPLLQLAVPEFKDCSQEEIVQCLDLSSITKDDFVSDIPDIKSNSKISTDNNELSSLMEKLVRFDLRFRVRNPRLSSKTLRVNLHIDFEAQLTYRPKKPSYPILKRAIYYVARDLSSQLSVVTNTTDYSKLEKCYSIWICTKDIPKRLQNTMTEYSFTRKDMIGTAEEPLEYYDLMSVIIIRRGREPDEKGIFDYLAGLFSSDVKRIEEYSHIEWSEPFQKEVGNMTGFGDEIYRKGIQSGKIEGRLEGHREGRLEGRLEGRREGQILGALMCGKTPEQVAEMFNVSLEKVREIQEEELLVK